MEQCRKKIKLYKFN